MSQNLSRAAAATVAAKALKPALMAAGLILVAAVLPLVGNGAAQTELTTTLAQGGLRGQSLFLLLATLLTAIGLPRQIPAFAAGYAFEDWQWNNETLEAGYVHRVVRDTVHFKRRRAGSQHSEAQRRGVLVRPTKVFGYAWTEREWEAGGKAGAPQPPPLFSQG